MTRYASGKIPRVPGVRADTGQHKAGRSRGGPVRTCSGCGRKAPQLELLRFVARQGTLVHAPKGPGRGVYTCPRLTCFERAMERRAFNRTLRATVQVDPELTRLYTDANG